VKAEATSRIRVFSGPNGSGKSTLVDRLLTSNIPLYRVINPDRIEEDLNSRTGLALSDYGLTLTKAQFHKYVEKSSYPFEVKTSARGIRFEGMNMISPRSTKTSYNAALVAACFRAKLIASQESFSFESVFSHPSKLQELKRANQQGYRIYLYFVAMDAAELCIGRVRERVASGGHNVPEAKIRKRYAASLANLTQALELSYRAYIFDNSGREAVLLAEQTPHGNLNLMRERMPIWFAQHVIEKLRYK
jgi:predicted ABC-type ATPase